MWTTVFFQCLTPKKDRVINVNGLNPVVRLWIVL